MKESTALAAKLAQNFWRMSQGDVAMADGEPEEVWVSTAKRQSEVLKSTTGASTNMRCACLIRSVCDTCHWQLVVLVLPYSSGDARSPLLQWVRSNTA
jgi:hypothetical protein